MTDSLVSKPAPEAPLHEDLKVGAGQLALAIYGEDTEETRRDIYRNPMNLSFFKHGNFIAGLMSQIRAEIQRRASDAAAENSRRQQQRPQKTVVKPRRQKAEVSSRPRADA